MKKGPVPKSIWGRMWAKAFIDPAFNSLIQTDMREAVKTFVGDYVEPLFDAEHRLASKGLRDFYDALEKLRDENKSKLENFRDDLKGVRAPDDDIKAILNMTMPNKWILTEFATDRPCTVMND